MQKAMRKILLVEDNPGDVRLIQDLFIGSDFKDYAMEDVSDLETGMTLLETQSFDAVLLDLGLPDSDGLDTLTRIVEEGGGTPVIVMTGPLKNDQALNLIRAGAQDYLTKGEIDSILLRKAVEYAIERHRLDSELHDSRRETERQRDLQVLETRAAARQTQITAESFGERTLRAAEPDVFELLVEEYVSLMEGALDRRALRDVPGLESRIQGLAQRLGSLRASPKDLTEVHVAGHKRATENAKSRRREAMSSEGQLLLIETMGYLALYYRTFMGPSPHLRPVMETMTRDR